MADTVIPPVYNDGIISICTSDSDLDILEADDTPFPLTREALAAFRDALMEFSPTFKTVRIDVHASQKQCKAKNSTDPRSEVAIALEKALPDFFAKLPKEYTQLEITGFPDTDKSDWLTWLLEIMASSVLEDILRRVHILTFHFPNFTDGYSKEVYTVYHPKGPNGVADTINVEYILKAEQIGRLAYLDGLDLPGWTIAMTELHISNPKPESLALVNISGEDIGPWKPVIDFILAHREIASLTIPGVLSKHMDLFTHIACFYDRPNLKSLDLGGGYESYNTAAKSTWIYG